MTEDTFDAEALRKAAKIAYKNKEFAQAAAFYERLLASPTGPEASIIADRTGYSSSLISLDRLDEAAEQLRQATILAPQDVRLRVKLAEVLSRGGAHAEAAEQFAECARLEPDVADHEWRRGLELKMVERRQGSDAPSPGAPPLQRHRIDSGAALADEFLPRPASTGAVAQAAPAFETPTPADGAIKNRRRPRLSRRAGIVIEALALVIGALWLRNQFG